MSVPPSPPQSMCVYCRTPMAHGMIALQEVHVAMTRLFIPFCRYAQCPRRLLRISNVKRHERVECPGVQVSCRLARFGCEWHGYRGNVYLHQMNDCSIAKDEMLLAFLLEDDGYPPGHGFCDPGNGCRWAKLVILLLASPSAIVKNRRQWERLLAHQKEDLETIFGMFYCISGLVSWILVAITSITLPPKRDASRYETMAQNLTYL